MRREIYRMQPAEARRFLDQAPFLHLAAVLPDGAPLLRTLDFAVLDDAVVFHGAAVGEKVEAVGRPVVLSAEERVAQLPSYFSDDERACSASTLYRSVQVHGVLEAVDAPAEKVHALEALMLRHQPEGGYRSIDAEHALYRKDVAAVAVTRVRFTQIDGKAKLAQNRTPEERRRLLEELWKRGAPGDAGAVDLVRAANPDTPVPAFLQAPLGLTLLCAPGPERRAEAARLVQHAYWNPDVPLSALERAHGATAAWVGAVDEQGVLVATARAISDSVKWAGIFDVWVNEPWRGKKTASALMRLLLDHPAVRAARTVWLRTRDAQPLYRKLGFVEDRTSPSPGRDYSSTEMLLHR